MDEPKKEQFTRDLFFVFVSVGAAVWLTKNGYISDLLEGVRDVGFWGSILAGMFYVSIFTAAPAAAALLEIAQTTPLWVVALGGGLGGLMGDLIIFQFMKDHLAEDIKWVMKKTGHRRLFYLFRRKLFHWFVPFIGAIVVASPFPDEIGLAMMGLSRMRLRVFVPVSFALDFLGVYVLVYLVSLLSS